MAVDEASSATSAASRTGSRASKGAPGLPKDQHNFHRSPRSVLVVHLELGLCRSTSSQTRSMSLNPRKPKSLLISGRNPIVRP